jgi:putative transposase
MTRNFLRAIRVESLEELKNRINQYIKLLNEEPVIFMWKYKVEEKYQIPAEL